MIKTAWVQQRVSRRRFMIAAIGGSMAATAARAAEPKAAREGFESELNAVQELVRKAGLKGVRSSESEFYYGIGDAPDAYRKRAIEICHELASVYLKHFQDKGFAVEAPKRKLIVITLKSRKSYETLIEDAPGADVGGHYDLETNALVVFDFTADKDKKDASSRRINTFTLIHESLHQLMFNTGLLDRQADVPRAVSEGLATYGELWLSSARRVPFGRVNMRRLQVLVDSRAAGDEWLPLEKLLTDDNLLDQGETVQEAYAQSWLLVHYFMRPDRTAKFREYLSTLKTRRSPEQRREDAQTHLGDLGKLDGNLKRYMTQQMR